MNRCQPPRQFRELADASKQHLWGRIFEGGCAALDVGGVIHTERIEPQRRAEIADLHHWLLRAREDEEVGRLQVPVEDVLAVQPSQPPHHLESQPLDKLWGDVDERVILDVLLQTQVICRLHIDTDDPLLIIDMRGEGPGDVGHPILSSPVKYV